MKPLPLSKGSSVVLIAPSSPFERTKLPKGLEILHGMALIPTYSERIYQSEGYLAGPDALRLQELVSALCDESGDAVIPVRGGYGSMRLLRGLSGHAKGIRPKFFMGFSDITAIHLFLMAEIGLTTFHGPNVISMSRLDDASISRLRATLFGLDPENTFLYAGLTPLVSGRAKGRTVVGNLSLLTSLIGTPWAAPLEGSLLVLEDVAEPLYKIDRMLTQLALQPNFSGIRGFAFGDLGVPEGERDGLEMLLRRFAEDVGRPTVMGFPIGHGARNFPVPQGVEALLDADLGIFRVLESPYG